MFMGYGIEVKCKKCKFKQIYHLGVGMMFPRVYQRIVGAVRNGEYGEEWKKFFEENTGAAIMAEQRLYQCSACKHLEQDYDLSLYLNKNGTAPEHDYWPHWCDFDHEYKFVKNYIHKCPKCSARMHKIKDFENTKLPCPKCGSDLKIDDGICWD